MTSVVSPMDERSARVKKRESEKERHATEWSVTCTLVGSCVIAYMDQHAAVSIRGLGGREGVLAGGGLSHGREGTFIIFAPVSPPTPCRGGRGHSRRKKETGVHAHVQWSWNPVGIFSSPKMNPQHCVPTLNDNGFVLWESRAIISYLITKYGSEEDRERLLPSDPEARARIDRMWYFDVGCLYKSITDYYLPQLMSGQPADHQKANALKQNLDYLDIFLEDTPYVSGETVTAADLSILASVTHLESVDFRYEGYQNIAAWAKKLKAELPYYIACNKEGIEMFSKWSKTRLPVKKNK